ncbi:hypothetical protein HK101_010152 [Irineochytrium annulatum]|nr:hypothetical protein HK101_010152 [Irineochytrium annulatum]
MPPIAKRQLCKFGSACYRKNPDHLREFRHPTVKTTASSGDDDDDNNDGAHDVPADEDEDEDIGDVEIIPRPMPSTPTAAKRPAPPKRAGSVILDTVTNVSEEGKVMEETEDDGTDVDEPVVKADGVDAEDKGEGSSDVFPLIKGLSPENVLDDGEEVESGKYKMKRVGTHYTCTCPSWKIHKAPVEARTCMHLKSVLGEKYELARCKPPAATKPKSKPRAKPDVDMDVDDDDDDDGDDDAHPSPAKSTRAAKKATKKAAKRKRNEDDDEDDDDDKPSKSKKSALIKNPQVLLAKKWEEGKVDPTGWWISEKLDGVRAYWDPHAEAFISRLGNKFFAPAWYTKDLPRDMSLDGELFTGRGNFSATVSIIKKHNPGPEWKRVEYQIFDAPSIGDLPFEKRLEKISEQFQKTPVPHVRLVSHEKCKSVTHVHALLKKVEAKGGEGLMLREPRSRYEHRRSSSLLKVKSFYDAEAVVIGTQLGSGKNSAVMGALRCRMASGREFKVGSGFTDDDRRRPPKVGSVIVYRFQELSKTGAPRFPTYVGLAIDKKKAKDASIRPIQRSKSDVKRDKNAMDDGDDDAEAEEEDE